MLKGFYSVWKVYYFFILSSFHAYSYFRDFIIFTSFKSDIRCGTIEPSQRILRDDDAKAPDSSESNNTATVVVTQPTVSSISTPEAAFSLPRSADTKPSKTHEASPRYIDINSVKKQLFLPAQRSQEALTPSSGPKRNYKMKEDDLWTKPFS
jgi:hypothetical protein